MALRMVKVDGVQAVLTNLRKTAKAKHKALELGLVKAGLFLQRQSQKVVPVDTGALKNSAFTRLDRKKDKEPEVFVGYTMFYAIYVHENLYARHKPGKIAKYLEIPAKRYRQELYGIIRKELEKRRAGSMPQLGSAPKRKTPPKSTKKRKRK